MHKAVSVPAAHSYRLRRQEETRRGHCGAGDCHSQLRARLGLRTATPPPFKLRDPSAAPTALLRLATLTRSGSRPACGGSH
jgi:hypothetical protein